MPRDLNGNYTLPAGNPVVTGTIIDALWANPTMADVATELQASLDRFGRGGMLAPFKFLDGLAAAPGITWTSEPTMGIYRAGASDMRATVAGVPRMRWTGTGVDVWDSAGAAWVVLSDINGLNYLPKTGGTLLGNLGIGAPGAPFVANGPLHVESLAGGIAGADVIIRRNGAGTATISENPQIQFLNNTDSRGAALQLHPGGGFQFFTHNGGAWLQVASMPVVGGFQLFTGGGLTLWNSTNTSNRSIAMAAEIFVDGRGGMQHWTDPALVSGAVIASVAGPPPASTPGNLWLVYE